LYIQLDPVPAASYSAWADLTDCSRLPEFSETPDRRSVEVPAGKGSNQDRLPQHFIHLEKGTSVLISTIRKLLSISSPVWSKSLFQIWWLLAINQVLKHSWWITYP